MKELLALLKLMNGKEGRLIEVAKGKYLLTGNIIKDTVKIIQNG